MLDSPERVVPDRVEQIGHTLEFLPEDNTVIRCFGITLASGDYCHYSRFEFKGNMITWISNSIITTIMIIIIIIRVEGKGNKITRITKTKITIGEKLFDQDTYTVHQVMIVMMRLTKVVNH